ncbi:NRAMP family divalent metal transporter [Mycobacterium nebraskense]|uniref:NRAMP family metal ion transporter n=1 Tax=Mycobacterium nebraskense TaxID=244292 RepID=A0A0F5NAN3_9MYCO|nr:divalent metal cation transporter [Mycobacterium nebraskense]KKC04096.1 NRAMP family metal ion transporter [Mycobacterium nebraskense]KLO41228.1 NRAMP family metal ion transporter [Mycobacterium nebraskense]MBI2694164.1 divalent metal cation transporter [Mycobacterium nebraskense]MCV7119096.1 divalent metal cation transporter [Mycobacterium nebraskense]ORW15290.1 NRAMP family metal ion transporter [Mycobacterium nebraskense]
MTDTSTPVAEEFDGQPPVSLRARGRWVRWGLLAVWGPGLVVMLADTDAGSLITASQSGSQWGYRMVLPQLILMPILYCVQEMTVRLGIVTKRGHGALIRERFGRGWAWLSAFTLFASAIGALLTEFAGVAGVGELFGVSRWVSIPIATAALLALAFTGSYRRVERIGLIVGSAELAFLVAMVLARPRLDALLDGMSSMPLGNSSYLLLVAANVGAVIMPWMIFYQQGAVVDKRLSEATIRQARYDTATGAVLTQLIMIAVVVTMASTVGAHDGGGSLNTVGEIANSLTPYLGRTGGTVLFGLGMLGAALVAAIVASLAGAWGLAEVFGWRHTLNERPNRETAKFYVTYALAHIVGAVLVLASVDLVNLAVEVEVMNALLLPIVLGLLLVLEAKALPEHWRMRGLHKYVTRALCLVVIGFGLYMVPQALGWT